MSSNSPKNRDYFITINENAECFNDVEEIIKNELNCKIYALILHNKDFFSVVDGETGETTLTPKRQHYHLMVELRNPISFASIQNKFKGAHIEVPKYKKSAYQYLLHNSKNSKEKYQYDFSEIITNAPEQVKFAIENEDFEMFKENLFLTYIAQGTLTTYQFTKRFGLNAYKQYWPVYQVMIRELETDQEMQQDYAKIKQELLENELPW